MPATTYLQTILLSFTALDINRLRAYLKEEYTYGNTTKEFFLNEFESIFEAHRDSGDTELLLFPGACVSLTCSNCGQKGYRFVGNHSKNYFDLIFELEGDEITDIYACMEFKSDTKVQGLGTQADVYINIDDQIDFHKTPEYWAKVYAAQDAYNELVGQPLRKFNLQDVNYWLAKHADLYKRIGGYSVFNPPMKWNPFLSAYDSTRKLIKFVFDNLDEIRQANQSLAELKTEQETIDWLVKYEAISHSSSLDTLLERISDGGNIYYDKDNLFLFSSEEYQEVCSFYDSYLKYNYPLIEKYTIYTVEEELEMFTEENIRNEKPDLDSLRFHLESRKDLAELGFNLPFYLQDKDKSDEEIPF